MNGVSLAQAVIEFTPAGDIITANANFLSTMGYSLDEIKGRHHRMFVEPAFAASPEYQAFWAKLNRGEHVADIFVRIAKGDRKVHLLGLLHSHLGSERARGQGGQIRDRHDRLDGTPRRIVAPRA